MGHRAGENAQILALGEALGWAFEIKRFVHHWYYFIASLPKRMGLVGIDKRKSSPLQPPWPDLIISAGFRNEPVCRWIRAQSGGRTRLVHIGRPWAGIRHFDLVVTTPQYRLPDHPRVLHNQTTLNRVTPSRLAEAAAMWEPRVFHLPKPRIAVMVGGSSGPYNFDRVAAERLGRQASALAAGEGGSLLVTTSSRTPKASLDSLVAALSCPAECYRWMPDDPENPYFGYLALGDALIVTGDSIAMLSEACATRKPVYIFDLGGMRAPAGCDDRRGKVALWLRGSWGFSHTKALSYRLLMRLGPQFLSRDLRLVYDYLISTGRAVWLGQSFPPGQPPSLEDVPRAVRRIRALLHADPTPILTDQGLGPGADRS